MYKHSPLLQSILHNSNKTPNKVAIIINGIEISYNQLVSNIRKAANILIEKGLKPKDRILLTASKNIEFLYYYFGAQCIGVTNVIVDASTYQERLQYFEELSKSNFCIGYNSNTLPSILYSDVNFDDVKEFDSTFKELSVNDIAEILFTTGTTGAPKGVCLSHYNIFSSASNINQYIQNDVNDVELLALPICHSFGLGRIRCNLINGATIVILENFANIRKFLKAFELYQITGFGIVPSAWAYIRKLSGTRIKNYASQVKYIEIGSAAMPIETKKELLSMFPNTRICMHYGLTEASRNCFQEFHDIDHLNSIGKPVCDSVNIKIFDTNGNELPNNTNGEICVKGNMVMSHYLDIKDNESAFWNDYFRTGDYGYIDNNNYVYLLGREKEMINIGGKKVSPIEVEDAIMSLGVGDCICCAIRDHNNIMGEEIKCYILKYSTNLSFKEIDSLLANKLELYKRPTAYEWIDEIPVTASGKKKRLNIN